MNARDKTCTIEGCDKKVLCRGLCGGHYWRLTYHGDPTGGGTVHGELQRFFREEVLTYEGNDCLYNWPYHASAGYPKMAYKGKKMVVHRALCFEVNGPPPTPKHHSAHSCGNGKIGCINKRHVSWKTPLENSADTVRHGRSLRGARNPITKLSEDSARKAKEMLSEGKGPAEIARILGSTRDIIKSIKAGKSWAWL